MARSRRERARRASRAGSVERSRAREWEGAAGNRAGGATASTGGVVEGIEPRMDEGQQDNIEGIELPNFDHARDLRNAGRSQEIADDANVLNSGGRRSEVVDGVEFTAL